MGNTVYVPVSPTRKDRPSGELEKDDLARNLTKGDSARDDLEPARGVFFAFVICLVMWTTAMVLGGWLFR